MLADSCSSTLPPPDGTNEPHRTDLYFNEMNSSLVISPVNLLSKRILLFDDITLQFVRCVCLQTEVPTLI